MPRTNVWLYRDDDGTVPLLEWLDDLPQKVRDKCRVKIERLRELGYELRRPEADYLRDGIYELRAKAALTQRQLAKLVGTTASVICLLEDADYERHSLAMLRRIAAALQQRVEIRFVPARKTRSA